MAVSCWRPPAYVASATTSRSPSSLAGDGEEIDSLMRPSALLGGALGSIRIGRARPAWGADEVLQFSGPGHSQRIGGRERRFLLWTVFRIPGSARREADRDPCALL